MRLSLRTPITPTSSENCDPKQIELILFFISFAHDAGKHSGLQALGQWTVTSNWEATDLRCICYCATLCSPKLAINPTHMQA